MRDLCIGYNSLSDTIGASKSGPKFENSKAASHEDSVEDRIRSENKPRGARTWTWLVLGDDGQISNTRDKKMHVNMQIQELSFLYTKTLFQATVEIWERLRPTVYQLSDETS